MEQRPSWATNRSSASQKIPHILWNPKSLFPHSQSPATCPDPELDHQIYAPSHLLEIHFIIIFKSTQVWIL